MSTLACESIAVEGTQFACVLCGGAKSSQVYSATFHGDYQPEHISITDNAYGQTGRIVRCCDCGMVSAFPRPRSEHLVDLYQQLVDPRYQDEETGRRDSFRRILHYAAQLSVPNCRALDIGASTGVLLDEARQAGFDGTGIEPSHWAVQTAWDRFGVKVIEGVLPHADLPRWSFGLATMLDVIEHVDDPRRLVLNAAETLTDQGLLVVTTPNFDSLVRRVLGQRWWHCRPAHVHYFTRATLERLLVSCGFHVEQVRSFGWTFSVDYWTSRLDKLGWVAATLRGLRNRSWGRRLLSARVRINFFDSTTVFARLERRVVAHGAD